MRYLLIGNGPTANLDAIARSADVIAQINTCKYADQLPPDKTKYVFVSNKRGRTISEIALALRDKAPFLPSAKIILTRNEWLYGPKRLVIKAFASWDWPDDDWHPIDGYTVGLSFSMALEAKMLVTGMHFSQMPSTGMIAYEWLSKRLSPGDSLSLRGFTFEGWAGHSWETEKKLIHPVEYPGFRDDVSYERRNINLP